MSTNPELADGQGSPVFAFAILAALTIACVPMLIPPFEMNGDTSWLIHVAERMLAGDKLYVDIIETNPPMSVLLYLPAVWLAQVSGMSAEWLVYGQTLLVSVVSLSLTGHIARRYLALDKQGWWLMLAATAIAFLLVPSRSFTQREHLAAMLVLPTILCFAARAEGARPSLTLALVCGVLAGLSASIKPHFALAVALPAALAAVYSRSPRPLFAPEALLAGGIAAAYVVVWLLGFPEFFGPPLFLTTNAYVLYTYRLGDYFSDPPALAMLAIVALTCCTLIGAGMGVRIFIVGSGVLAFALAFALQGKGFAYHLYPIAALALITGAIAATGSALLSRVAFLGLAICAYVSALYSERYPATDDLKRALVAQKPRPSLIIFTFDIAINFPLVRQIDGIWASRMVSTWASNSAGHVIHRGADAAQLARTREVIALERTWFAEDVNRNRPDILVFDGQILRDDMLSHEGFKAAFDGHYRLTGTAQNGRFLLYRKNDG